MAKAIIKQPNGKFCIYSTIIDNVTHYDLTEPEIVDVFLDEEKERILSRVRIMVEEIETQPKRRSFHQTSYSEMLDRIKEIHGENEVIEIKTLIETN